MKSLYDEITPLLDADELILFQKILEMEASWEKFRSGNHLGLSAHQMPDFQPFTETEKELVLSIKGKRDIAKLIYSNETKDSELWFEMFLFSFTLDDISALDRLIYPENYN